MKKVLFSMVLTISCVGLVGCASQKITEPAGPLCLQNTSNDQAMISAQAILEKMHFDIEKFDPEAHYIRTRPLSGEQFFEFWRKDNASGFAHSQANLHSIRRIVELEFSPEGTTTCLQCRVQVLRLSMPEQPIQGAALFGGLFTKSHSRYQTLEIDTDRAENIEWLDAGSDHALEQRILEFIQNDTQKVKSR